MHEASESLARYDAGSEALTPDTFLPPEPRTLAETGLSPDTLSDLLLKTLYSARTLDGMAMSRTVKLPWTIVNEALDSLRHAKYCEVSPGGGLLGHSYRYTITNQGIARAREVMARSQYVGPAPVSLDAYTTAMAQQASAFPPVSRSAAGEAMRGLVIDQGLVDKVATAANSTRAVMLYGATGNGKTTVAQAMGDMLDGHLFIPYAIEIDNQIIRVFDSRSHVQALDSAKPADDRDDRGPIHLTRRHRYDARWVKIRRPLVIAGAELTLDQFEVTYDGQAAAYQAPLQMKANGGILVIDDFGRQQVSPRELLNRLIFPLESKFDFLTLPGGQSIRIPFTLLVVLATNLAPTDLLDEAFLRRIPHKIAFPDPTPDQFTAIMWQECINQKVPFDQEVVEYLLAEHYTNRNRPLRACHPRDIVGHVVEFARLDGSQPRLTREAVDRAAEVYFV